MAPRPTRLSASARVCGFSASRKSPVTSTGSAAVRNARLLAPFNPHANSSFHALDPGSGAMRRNTYGHGPLPCNGERVQSCSGVTGSYQHVGAGHNTFLAQLRSPRRTPNAVSGGLRRLVEPGALASLGIHGFFTVAIARL